MLITFGSFEELTGRTGSRDYVQREVRAQTKKEDQRCFEKFADEVSVELGDAVREIHEVSNRIHSGLEGLEKFSPLEDDEILKFSLTELINLITESKPSAGDNIYVNLNGNSHYGLYVGGNEVIHYLNDKRGVVVESLANFAKGETVLLIDTPQIYSAREVISRAYSRLGELDYGLFNDSGEHFVYWCKRGD